MGTKNNPGRYDCYAAADPDEPMFVLLARDKHAAALVNLWAAMKRLELAGMAPDNIPPAKLMKIREAEHCANSMIGWRTLHGGDDPSGVRMLAEALAVLAELCDAVVTIEQTPLQPGQRGGYAHSVTVGRRQ